jgi:hypothetical protein
MNANELNKWIDNSPYTEGEEVIVLLRQQQDEIEALKAKTLTDDEIRSCIVEIEVNKPDMFINFARAILRKAQEK